MPQGKHVKVIIAPDGACTVDAVHFTGPSCHTATGEIRAALGGRVVGQYVKAEARVGERRGQPEREAAR